MRFWISEERHCFYLHFRPCVERISGTKVVTYPRSYMFYLWLEQNLLLLVLVMY